MRRRGARRRRSAGAEKIGANKFTGEARLVEGDARSLVGWAVGVAGRADRRVGVRGNRQAHGPVERYGDGRRKD